jgi:hypothetical protein
MPATIPTQEDLDALKLALEEHLKVVEAKLLEYDGLPEREKHDFSDLELRVKKLEGDPETIAPTVKVQEELELRVKELEGLMEGVVASLKKLVENPEPSPWRSDEPIMKEVHPEVLPPEEVDPALEEDPAPPKRSHHKKPDKED